MLFDKTESLISRILIGMGLSDINIISAIVILLIVFGIATLVYFICVFIIRKIGLRMIKRSASDFDDKLYSSKFFHRLSLFVPLFIIDKHIERIIYEFGINFGFIHKIVAIAYVVLIILILSSFLRVWNEVHMKKYKDGRSIKSLIQAIILVLWIIGVIIIISLLLDVKARTILGTLGAASAVLMLVFKDTILGLVGSVQLSTNKIVMLGDWIEMPDFNADGTIIDISLIAVKVQNFDNTVTSIPTYSLITHAVKNWTAMSKTGKRRIMRTIYIDQVSVKFCDDNLMDRLMKIDSIRDYVIYKGDEIGQDSYSGYVNDPEVLNTNRQTNLGIFRAYLNNYLRNNPRLDPKSTMMVRQLQPSNFGIPLQIYCFANTSEWVVYENIQSDLFDHIIASVECFDLHLFQSPSWHDYKVHGQKLMDTGVYTSNN